MSADRIKQMKRFRTLAASIVLLLTAPLAACAPEPHAQQAAGGSSTPSQNRDNDSDGSGDAGQPEKPAETAGIDPATCLEGSWVASNDFFLASIREFGDEIKSVAGEVLVTFGADGSLTTEYRSWLITAETEGVTVTILREGTDTGVYSATENSVTLQDQNMGSSLVISGSGMNMTVDAVPANYGDAPYTCDSSSAMISTIDGSMEMSRR